MKLTIANRLKLAWEVLTVRSGHGHTAQEKQLSTFMNGYVAGWDDKELNNDAEFPAWLGGRYQDLTKDEELKNGTDIK